MSEFSLHHTRKRCRGIGWLATAVLACTTTPDSSRAADVDITTSTSSGINLDLYTGTTVNIAPGVSVANTTFTLNCSSFAGICATTQAWSVTNQGTIGPSNFGNGITLKKGGSVVNQGMIDGGTGGNGVWIEGAPGSVDNKAGATIKGTNGGVVFKIGGPEGTVINAGTITSAGLSAVNLGGGGSFTNLAGGVVQSHGGANAVALVLGTSRSVINSGLIQSNDSGYATGVAIQNGTVVNNASGQILGAFNGVWANGSSATSITNAGLIEASKAAAGGSGIEVDGGGAVNNSGTIRSSSLDSTDAGILFSGAGSITNSGAIESLTAGLAVKFQGSATHTLKLDTGSTLGGKVQGGSGADNLVLLGTGSESAAKFLGFETLSMQGAAWTMTGAGAFATSATVQSGILSVDGTLTSPQVKVQTGGALGGVGTVVGTATIDSGGTLAPGNSIGTLNVTGTLTFALGSFYAIDANPAGQADKTVVTGLATIQGGTVVVLAGAGTYAPATTYTILTAGDGRAGTFDSVTSNFAFLTPSLTYDANNVYLTLARNSIDFDAIGGTRNERAAGRSVESLGAGSTVYDAVLPLDAPSARAAFDALSGEIHATADAMFIEDSRFVRDAALDRLRAASDRTPAPGDDRKIWMRGFGAWGHWDGNDNAASFGRDIGGVFAGVDGEMAENWRMGLLAGYSHSTLSVGGRDSSAGSDDYHLGVYGGTQRGPLAFRSGLAFAWHDIAIDRDVQFPGFSNTLKSKYDAETAQAFAELGYHIEAGLDGAVGLEPFANLAYVHQHTDEFTEKGGVAALSGEAATTDLTFTTLGLRAMADFTVGDADLTARGMLGWRHAFGDTTPVTSMAFSGGTSFDIASAPIARDTAVVEAGMDMALTPAARLGLSYDAVLDTSVTDQSVRGTLKLSF